jgi:hypothetical protein
LNIFIKPSNFKLSINKKKLNAIYTQQKSCFNITHKHPLPNTRLYKFIDLKKPKILIPISVISKNYEMIPSLVKKQVSNNKLNRL